MNPNSVAAAGDHVYVEYRVPIDGPLREGGMGRFCCGIGSIGVNLSNVFALTQKSKRNLDRALIPVRNGADEPVLAAATSQRDEFPWTAIEHAYLIPRGRHLLDEFEVVLAGVVL